MVFDLENYEKVIRGEVWDDNAASRTYNIPAIEVLRRLVDNTDINLVKAPEVDDFVWRELMEEVGLRRNPENGSMRADWQSVTNLVTYTNAWIIEHQGKYGLDPVRIEAITFAERAATYALRNVTERERLELPYDEGFKEIVKFQELTGSGDSKFNLEEFEIFWSRFQNVRMDNLDDLKAHYWRLFEREADKLGRLERKYQDEKIVECYYNLATCFMSWRYYWNHGMKIHCVGELMAKFGIQLIRREQAYLLLRGRVDA